jgi:hypothetical protein
MFIEITAPISSNVIPARNSTQRRNYPLQKGPLKKIKDLQVLPIVMKIITVGKA